MAVPVVITRTRPDADALAEKLAALGYDPVIDPMLRVHATGMAMPHDPLCAEGLVVTSAQALRHLNTLVREVALKHKPIYAVGPRTATLARELGWTQVHDGGGDVRALGSFLKSRREITPQSRLLHICGRDVARDTRGTLEGLQARVWDWVVYETDPAQGFTPAVDKLVRTGSRAAVLLYSARAAAVFRENVQTYGDAAHCNAMIFLCLSPAVLESLGSLPCGGSYAADTPDEDALLALLRQHCPPVS